MKCDLLRNLYSAENGNDISMNINQEYRVWVDYTGHVRWTPLMKWVTACEMNVYYFPFDTQHCSVIFTNWVYAANLVNLTLAKNEIFYDNFHNHSEWLLTKSEVSDLLYYLIT